MRSKDYSNYLDSFTPLSPHEMTRLALVEGIKGKYPLGERLQYKRLLHRYLDLENADIERLFQLFTRHHDPEDTFYGPNDRQMNDLVSKVHYNSHNWKSANYKKLKQEGIVLDYSGSRRGLVQILELIDQRKVIACHDWHIDSKTSYLKHIPWQRKVVLNGPDVIMDYARRNDFYDKLPESLTKGRRITNPVKDLLRQHGFSFANALKASIDQTLKSKKYQERDISVFTIKNPNGSELRWHQYNPVESAEHFVNIRMRQDMGDNNQKVFVKLGGANHELNPGNLYYGLNVFSVPKRIPLEVTHNTVQAHFLPDAGARDVLEYFHTVTDCDCPHALNLRNFQERRGMRTYVIPTFDIHAGLVDLEILAKKGVDARDIFSCQNNLSPLPTENNIYFFDKAKYNLFIENSKRFYAGKIALDLLANERAKLRSFSDLYGPKSKLRTFSCRDMYFE